MKYIRYSILFFIFLNCSFFAGGQADLHLTVNNGSRDTIRPGDPVVLGVRLSNIQAQAAKMHNRAVHQNLEYLEEEYRDKSIDDEQYQDRKEELESSLKEENTIELSPEDIRSELVITMKENILQAEDIILCWTNTSDKSVELAAGDQIVMKFGIEPETTANWDYGSYPLQSSLDSLQSNVVRLTVHEKLPSIKSDTTSALDLATFYLECGDPGEALNIANEWIEKDPALLGAMILKGDALSALKQSTQALDAYERALKLFQQSYPDSYEPPEYLLDKISSLKRDR